MITMVRKHPYYYSTSSVSFSKGSSRHKRGRYSDPGPRGRGETVSTEEKLESLIIRLGEKVRDSLQLMASVISIDTSIY